MATSRVTAPASWNASGRITAASDTSVFVRNTDDQPIFWAITDGDVAPTFPVALGHIIDAGTDFALTLAAGERLWYATRAGVAEITLTTGDAL